MRWLLVACLAACSHDSLAIEVVTSDPDVARVELVLVERHCDACNGDAPPSSVMKGDGDVYYQYAGDRFTAPVSGGVAGFTLEPGSSDDIPKLAAIGFDAQNVAKAIALLDQDIQISQHLGEVIQLDLVTRDIAPVVGPLPGAFTIGADDEVVVWRAPNAPDTAQSCIAVISSTGKDTFVVPADDQDCDGITGAAECDPFWYLYAKPASTTQYCLAQESADKPCMVGTETGCVDGQSQAGCHPLDACVPQRACTDCSDPTDPECPDHVGTESAPGVARVHCTIPLVGGPGNYMACPTGIAPVNVDMPYASATTATCDPGFIKTPVMFPVNPQPSLAFDTGQGAVTLMIANSMMPCEFQIVPTANVSSIPSRSVPGLVVLHGPTRELLLPLVVEFTNATQTVCSGAATAASCTVDPASFADPMWSCARN